MMFIFILKSFFQLTKHILFGKKLDVLLYYPQHFNRSIKGTNPYFDPIVEICKENGLRYLILEEPDAGTFNPRDPQCVKADVFFYVVTIIRKLMGGIHKGETLLEIDTRVAHILDIITFHKFRAKRYITISCSMIDVLAELSPMSVVYDYQHGVIYNGHPAYLVEKDRLEPSFTRINRRVLLWGILYRHMFKGVLSEEALYERTRVVGYPINSAINITYQVKNCIIISLQITSDSEIWYLHLPKMLYDCLEQLKNFGGKVFLKHHPRFNNEVDLGDITVKYPFVEFTSKSLAELVSQTLFHITWSSTTCFEYANYGIPTYFLTDSVMHHGQTIFYEQYKYPLYAGMSLIDVMKRISNNKVYDEDCRVVKEWYDSAYAPFDKQQMLQILIGNED